MPAADSSPRALGGVELAKVLSVLTLVVVVYGLAAAHVPAMVGTPWSSCEVDRSAGCVLAYHLYEVPIVLFQAFFAWYGLRRLTPATIGRFRLLLGGSILLNGLFALFEASVLIDKLTGGSPMWEVWALTSLVVLLWSGVFLGLYVLDRLRS